MCVVSMVGDDWSRRDKWPQWPRELPFPNKDMNDIQELKARMVTLEIAVTMRTELEAAKQKDIDEGNPDCEMDDKVIILKKIADLLGETLDGIFPKEKTVR